jgi:hypothetical protein
LILCKFRIYSNLNRLQIYPILIFVQIWIDYEFVKILIFFPNSNLFQFHKSKFRCSTNMVGSRRKNNVWYLKREAVMYWTSKTEANYCGNRPNFMGRAHGTSTRETVCARVCGASNSCSRCRGGEDRGGGGRSLGKKMTAHGPPLLWCVRQRARRRVKR